MGIVIHSILVLCVTFLAGLGLGFAELVWSVWKGEDF